MANTGNKQQQQWDFNDPNKRFHITAELANTLQGRIYASTDRSNGKFTVIKETWKQLVESGKSRDGCPVPENFHEEKRIMTHLSNDPKVHPNFVHIICEWEEPLTYNYAMEGCKDGDLFDFVKNKHLTFLKKYRAKQFESNKRHYSKNALENNTNDKWINEVRHMFRQLIDCLDWMHSKGICHLDMSLENTMVYNKDECFIKIIDFGLAKQCNIETNEWKHNKRVGKRGYMAPEVYNKQTYDCRAADIWSCGVMLYMMLIGAPPYELPVQTCVPFKYLINKRLKEMLTHWKRLHYVTSDIIDLLIRIFRPERHRISMRDIKRHPFVGLTTPLYPNLGVTTTALATPIQSGSSGSAVTAGGEEVIEEQKAETYTQEARKPIEVQKAPAAGVASESNNRQDKQQKQPQQLPIVNNESYVSIVTDSHETPPQLAINSNNTSAQQSGLTVATSQQSQSSIFTIGTTQQSQNSTNSQHTPVGARAVSNSTNNNNNNNNMGNYKYSLVNSTTPQPSQPSQTLSPTQESNQSNNNTQIVYNNKNNSSNDNNNNDNKSNKSSINEKKQPKSDSGVKSGKSATDVEPSPEPQIESADPGSVDKGKHHDEYVDPDDEEIKRPASCFHCMIM